MKNKTWAENIMDWIIWGEALENKNYFKVQKAIDKAFQNKEDSNEEINRALDGSEVPEKYQSIPSDDDIFVQKEE